MSEMPETPKPLPRSWVARSEQVVLVLLALAVVAGVAWRAVRYWRLGAEPLTVVTPESGPTFRVNVNRAGWTTLTQVPGLGDVLAKRIVETRDARGGRFQSLDDLKAVDGIGDKVLEKLRPYLFLVEGDADDEPIRMLDGS